MDGVGDFGKGVGGLAKELVKEETTDILVGGFRIEGDGYLLAVLPIRLLGTHALARGPAEGLLARWGSKQLGKVRLAFEQLLRS